MSNARRELLLETGGSRYGREEWNPVAIKGLLLGCIAAISFAFTADDLIDTFSAYIIHVCAVPFIQENTSIFSCIENANPKK